MCLRDTMKKLLTTAILVEILVHHGSASSTPNTHSTQFSIRDFRRCCSRGKEIAWSRNDRKVGHELCQTSTNVTNERSLNGQLQCELVQKSCCIASRRLRACRIGVDHSLKNNGSDCAEENFQSQVTDDLMPVAKECCVCQTKLGLSSDYSTNQSRCRDTRCCHLFETIGLLKSTVSIPQNPIRNELRKFAHTVDTSGPTTTYLMDDPGEFEMSFVGGLGFPTISDNTTSVRRVSVGVQPIKCQKNFVWDEKQELCIRMLTACPIGMYLNPNTNRCIPGLKAQSDRCNDGYVYNQSMGVCEDINECIEGLPTGEKACNSQDMQCINLPGTYECVCDTGFSMASDGTCIDINECNQVANPCRTGQQCVNIIGSFQCVRQVPCGYGYVLNPKTQECEDVNECKADPNICGRGMMCVNVRGGHRCVDKQCPGKAKRDKFGNCVPCPSGFEFNITSGTCEDLNECNDGAQCKPWERCVNKQGYFVCEQKLNCPHGFRINKNGTECDDIDECLEKLFNCEHWEVCVNTNGSYNCAPSTCHPSQIFDYETKSCTCEKGMRFENGVCLDINECEERPGICPIDQTCLNHIGGFRCIRLHDCQPGFQRKNKFEPCVDIDECKQGVANCGENMYCVNTVGAYQCMCKRGYKNLDAETCVDVDECVLFGSNSICPDARARCVNTNGSHICVCPEGYQWTDYPTPKCADVDECVNQPTICGTPHQCINLDGSYKCVCANGYTLGADQKTCIDVDECALQQHRPENDKLCSHSMCINIPGSYKCGCPDGFRLGRGGFCYDVDECNELPDVCDSKRAHGLTQACVNLMGGYRCVSNQCPPHFTKSRLGNGFRCQLDPSHSCKFGDASCFTERPQRMDYLYIELDQETSVPQVLARVDTRHLPSGIIRADLRQDYANHLRTRNAIRAGKAFQLQRSRTQPGSVEVLLQRRLPAPVDILISLHLLSFKESLQTGHSITKLYLFVTQSATERIRWSKTPPYQHADFWTQLRYKQEQTP